MIETRKTRIKAKKKITRKKRNQKTKSLKYLQRQVLVDFLNHDFSKPMTHDSVGGYLDANGRQVSGELHMIIHRDLSLDSLEHLESLRQELIANLLPIAEPLVPLTRNRVQEYLDSLAARLNRMKFEPVFKIVAGQEKTARRRLLSGDQRTFSRGAGEWIVTMDFSAGVAYAPERDFYGMIAEGLVNGELDLLRRCPYELCQQFFTAWERRQIFCIPQHGRLYYDEPERAVERVNISRGKLN